MPLEDPKPVGAADTLFRDSQKQSQNNPMKATSVLGKQPQPGPFQSAGPRFRPHTLRLP